MYYLYDITTSIFTEITTTTITASKVSTAKDEDTKDKI